jgi:hypothetical protein
MAGEAVTGTKPGEVREALPALAAIEKVLADPARLVAVLAEAEDDEQATRSIAAAYGISPAHAAAVLDQQFRLLVRSRRAVVTEELRILRADWEEPREVALRVTGRRSAVLLLDGSEHRFTAGGLQSLLDRVAHFLHEQVVVPRLQPVVVATGLDGRDPVRLRVWPNGSIHFEYADD